MPKHWMIIFSQRIERTRKVRYTQHDEVSGVFYNDPEIEPQPWQPLRDKVMQNSIKENISLSENTDLERVKDAARLACLDEFVQSLPNGYDTVIGNEGYELSRGQIQRLIIARCIYKDPQIVLMDEGTSALDPKTEATVLDNLREFLKNKTAIIITHNIEAYRWADKFYRMDNDGCPKNYKRIISCGRSCRCCGC